MTEHRISLRAGGCAYHPDYVQPRDPGNAEVGPSPIRADFPYDDAGTRAYGNAWKTWQKQLADCHPTAAERAVRDHTLACLFGVHIKVASYMHNVHALRNLERMHPDDRALVVSVLESL